MATDISFPASLFLSIVNENDKVNFEKSDRDVAFQELDKIKININRFQVVPEFRPKRQIKGRPCLRARTKGQSVFQFFIQYIADEHAHS